MKITMENNQSHPSIAISDNEGMVVAKVYCCPDGTYIETATRAYQLPQGPRAMGDVWEPPRLDGFDLLGEPDGSLDDAETGVG
jgi:hypothetical protein